MPGGYQRDTLLPRGPRRSAERKSRRRTSARVRRRGAGGRPGRARPPGPGRIPGAEPRPRAESTDRPRGESGRRQPRRAGDPHGRAAGAPGASDAPDRPPPGAGESAGRPRQRGRRSGSGNPALGADPGARLPRAPRGFASWGETREPKPAPRSLSLRRRGGSQGPSALRKTSVARPKVFRARAREAATRPVSVV